MLYFLNFLFFHSDNPDDFVKIEFSSSEMRFLRRIKAVTLLDNVIHNSLNVESLLLRIERSQLKSFGHVCRMPQERLRKQALPAIRNGNSPVGRPRLKWLNHIFEDLRWNRLGLILFEMKESVEDRNVWRLNLELLASDPQGKAVNDKERKKVVWIFGCFKRKLATFLFIRLS